MCRLTHGIRSSVDTKAHDHGWATPPHHQCSLMCDDIEATVAELRSKGVAVRGEIEDQGFGLVTEIDVPGAGSMMLYQPQHELAHNLEG